MLVARLVGAVAPGPRARGLSMPSLHSPVLAACAAIVGLIAVSIPTAFLLQNYGNFTANLLQCRLQNYCKTTAILEQICGIGTCFFESQERR